MKHLKETNMTYCQHFKRATSISARLLLASGCAIIHAVYPDVFEWTATNVIKQMYHKFCEEKGENEDEG